MSIIPGPSSTDKGFPVLHTGSPTWQPAKRRLKKGNDNKKNSIQNLPTDILNEYGFNIIYKSHIPEY